MTVKHTYYGRLYNGDSESNLAARDARSDRAGSIRNRRKARKAYIRRRRYGIYDKKARGPLWLEVGADREAPFILEGRGSYKKSTLKM
jgi:hypothetical protein